jgi:hypothetical protein
MGIRAGQERFKPNAFKKILHSFFGGLFLKTQMLDYAFRNLIADFHNGIQNVKAVLKCYRDFVPSVVISFPFRQRKKLPARVTYTPAALRTVSQKPHNGQGKR